MNMDPDLTREFLLRAPDPTALEWTGPDAGPSTRAVSWPTPAGSLVHFPRLRKAGALNPT